jgi:hypothetical protein
MMGLPWTGDVPRETSVNESLALRNVVISLQSQPGCCRSIDSLTVEFGLKKRCLYDFVSVCSVFRICHRGADNSLEWFGLDRAEQVIARIREEIEFEASTATLTDLFRDWTDPSLPSLATTVVKLFFYLGAQSLDLRKIGKLLAQGKTKYKTMVRKLYTVATCLERAEIIRKTSVVSEIQLNAPLYAAHNGSKMDVRSLLNSRKELDGLAAITLRRKEFGVLGLSGQSMVRMEVPAWSPWDGQRHLGCFM